MHLRDDAYTVFSDLSAKKDDSRATPSEVAADVIMNEHSVKKRKPSRSPALIDDEIDSGAIQLLHAHKTEVRFKYG